MPEQQPKSSKFLKAINKYAEEQRTQIQKEVEDFKKEELEKAETEVLNNAFQMIQSEMAEMKTVISSNLSKKEMEGRKALFEKRNLIMNEVFNLAKEKLLEFAKSDKYIELIKKQVNSISKILNKPGTIIYVKNEDLKYAKVIQEEFGMECSIEVSDSIIIGGIYALNETMGIVADESLDSKLEEQKDWFVENSCLKVI